MTPEQKQKKKRQMRLRKLAHQIKGLPEDQKKECMDLLWAYERWYDYAASLQQDTEECKQSVWERNMYQSYLKFALHYALTGDVLSRNGVITFTREDDVRQSSNSEQKACLEKRDKELVEIDKSIECFGQASKQEREHFKKKLESKTFPRLVSKKQVPAQSFDRKITERSCMKD